MNDLLDLILGALNLIYGERWVAPFVFMLSSSVTGIRLSPTAPEFRLRP